MEAVARRHGVSPMCAALAWTLRDPMVVSIPKASNPAHMRENAKAIDIVLSAEDLAALDRDYPRPPMGTFDVWTN
ncbi:MAG: aldo/keto reductase [Alphaproteobacteria bacterium]|nr:aldo/keto reductase [Alphaproteobacteria bacterium]